MFRKIFTKRKTAVYLTLAATIFSSSMAAAQNSNYNYLYNNYNRVYSTNYNYNYSYNYSYSNNGLNSTYNKYPTWNWIIVDSKPSIPNTPTKPSTPTTPPVIETPSVSGLSSIELEVVRLINIERQKEGLKPLTATTELSNVARLKSQDMANKNYFSHTSPTYGSPFEMMKQFGIMYSTAGENIAKGQLSAQSVVNAWMNSSGHRANIMNPSFNTIGMGHFKSSGGTNYWTQMFTN